MLRALARDRDRARPRHRRARLSEEPARAIPGRPARSGAYQAAARPSAAAAPDRPRRARRRASAPGSTPCSGSATASSEVATIPYGNFGGYPVPYVDLAADRLLSERPRFPRQPAQDRDPRRCRGLCRPARGVRAQHRPRGRAGPRRCRPRRRPARFHPRQDARPRPAACAAERGARGRPRPLARPPRRARRTSPATGSTQAAAIVDGRLAAALDRQLAMLTELRRGAGTNPAAGRLPDGERFYAHVPALPHQHQPDARGGARDRPRADRRALRRGRSPAPRRGPDPGQRRRADHRARPAGALPLSEHRRRPRRAARRPHPA